eukprot:scaffold6482_cov18-Tisochrysis_lutea.AAC.1
MQNAQAPALLADLVIAKMILNDLPPLEEVLSALGGVGVQAAAAPAPAAPVGFHKQRRVLGGQAAAASAAVGLYVQCVFMYRAPMLWRCARAHSTIAFLAS